MEYQAIFGRGCVCVCVYAVGGVGGVVVGKGVSLVPVGKRRVSGHEDRGFEEVQSTRLGL